MALRRDESAQALAQVQLLQLVQVQGLQVQLFESDMVRSSREV